MTSTPSYFSQAFSRIKGLFDRPPLEVIAKPGLMTLLDLALYRSVEGELTASVSAVHALLQAWLDLKRQAQVLLQNHHGTNKKLARHSLEAACDAIEKIATDRLAASANLSDAYEASASFSSSSPSLVGVTNTVGAKEDTGRRQPKIQRPRDCWETARLVCPDHVWSDDVFCTSQRLLRHLMKQLPIDSSTSSVATFDDDNDDDENNGVAYELTRLQTLIQQDLPLRLHQFRVATEANAVVLKRLYLVKSEYRAPFRAFLESHQTVQKAPPLGLIVRYLNGDGDRRTGSSTTNGKDSKFSDLETVTLQDLLETPALIEALELERTIEHFEARLAKGIFGFTELARLLDYKKIRLNSVEGAVEDILPLHDLLQRLKCCLCRKVGPETSEGIRPIFLDLQGLPRDEEGPWQHCGSSSDELVEERIHSLVQQLQQLKVVCRTRHSLFNDRKGDYFDVPSTILKLCAKLDAELWEAQCLDWFDMVKRQRELAKDFTVLSEQIRQAEMEASIKTASPEALVLVKERLERLSQDCELRFEVLKDMAEDVCLREMNWKIVLAEPPKDGVLSLANTSCAGLVGRAMQLAGEPLPIG